MSESVLVKCMLKATALLVLITNSCVFESLSCGLCVCVCVGVPACVLLLFVRCSKVKGRKVIVGTSPLSKLPLALCSSLQPDLFILRLKRSHFLLESLPLTVQRCSRVCVRARVCVYCACVGRSRASFSVGKESFPPKERARRQCQRY